MAEIMARRIGFMVITMFIVSIAIFVISEVVPIDVARNILGQFATEESIAALTERLGLNCPTGVRYVIWIVGDDWIPGAREIAGTGLLPSGCTPGGGAERKGLIRGDMGISTQTGSEVTALISSILAGHSPICHRFQSSGKPCTATAST